MKIVIAIPGLSAGGAERVVSIIAGEWVKRGDGVTIVTFDKPGDRIYYPMHPAIKVVPLGMPGGRINPFKALTRTWARIRQLRGAILAEEPDVVLSFLTRTNIMTLAALLNTGIPVVVSERNNLSEQNIGLVWGSLRRLLYARAAGLVAITAAGLRQFANMQSGRAWAIPNPVEVPDDIPDSKGNRIVAVGRLVPQKGFDLLLDAYERVSSNYPDWKLVIYGEGPCLQSLLEQRDRLGLTDRVDLPGVTTRPGGWIERGGIYVLSSRFEGWSNTTNEAMAGGMAVLAADCDFGPREMITSGQNGLLVEPGNAASLAKGLFEMLGNPDRCREMAEAAEKSARRFSVDRIMQRWDHVIGQVVGVPKAQPAKPRHISYSPTEG